TCDATRSSWISMPKRAPMRSPFRHFPDVSRKGRPRKKRSNGHARQSKDIWKCLRRAGIRSRMTPSTSASSPSTFLSRLQWRLELGASTIVSGATMADRLRVVIETGPKGKKVVAVAPDWPGLTRGSTDEAGALGQLRAYIPRYAPVAALAGLAAEFAGISGYEVVERYTGTGSTDFWGISFGNSSFDLQAMSSAELERELALLRACWSFFDDVRSRVSAELRKGPRGGGRDRDQIVRHVLSSELDWSKRVVVRTPPEDLLTDDGLWMDR